MRSISEFSDYFFEFIVFIGLVCKSYTKRKGTYWVDVLTNELYKVIGHDRYYYVGLGDRNGTYVKWVSADYFDHCRKVSKKDLPLAILAELP